MNAREENAGTDAVSVDKDLQSLPGLGYFDDDIQAQLTETAKSISQDIVDVLSAQYRDARQKGGKTTLPASLWEPLRSKAYVLAAEHCEALARNLRNASANPHMDL